MGNNESCNLASKKCVPCEGGVPPLGQSERQYLLSQLKGWKILEGHHLSKDYRFPDFVSALNWVNKVGEIAETEGHHPNISLTWGYVRVDIWTHKIDNLTESDFILAAKLDAAT